ncbi:hypothetical protein EDD37DRAFT_665978 [Exophiala viscosa]|uniref:Uncharacterized protein n=1 Tax=Exophiala viscosa TaxID=2486360 RepID=A0AAN6E154_9EURO|nr:hypothetical protein EDD36DRAFT_416234 [Exophiala viscosa]KAI1624414.1 hypothetical protein EDD37DRAFT_665978 [Exophiala viscosa]
MANVIAIGGLVLASIAFHTYRSPDVKFGRTESVEPESTPTRGPSQRSMAPPASASSAALSSYTYPMIGQTAFGTPASGPQGSQTYGQQPFGPVPSQGESSRYSQQQRSEVQQQSYSQQPYVYSQRPPSAGLGIEFQSNRPAAVRPSALSKASVQGPNIPGLPPRNPGATPALRGDYSVSGGIGADHARSASRAMSIRSRASSDARTESNSPELRQSVEFGNPQQPPWTGTR